MNCTPSQLEFKNRMKDMLPTYIGASTSKETTLERLISTHNVIVDRTDTTERAYIALEIDKSPSKVATQKSRKFKDMEETEYSKKSKKRGLHIHDVLEAIVRARMAGTTPDRDKIDKTMLPAHFKVLVVAIDSIITMAKKKQAMIDPKGEITLDPERLLGSSSRGELGRIDLGIIYSNGTMDIVDYKTITPPSRLFNSRTGEFMGRHIFYKEKSEMYNTQATEYKLMIQDDYHATVNSVLLLPIITQYNEKGRLTNVKSFDISSTTDESDIINLIPTVSSKTSNKKLDILIRDLHKRIDILLNKTGSDAEKANNRSKASILQKQIREVQLEYKIGGLLQNIKVLKREYETAKAENNLTKEYLIDLKQDLETYINISHVFSEVEDFTEEENAKKISEDIDHTVAGLLGDIYQSNKALIKPTFDKSAIDSTTGEFKVQKVLSAISKIFKKAGSISNDFIAAAMNNIRKMHIDIKEDVEQDIEKMLTVENKAVAVTGSTRELYKYLINNDNKNLVSIYNQDYWDLLKEIEKEEDIGEKARRYKELLSINPDFEEEYLINKKKAVERIKREWVTNGRSLEDPRFNQYLKKREIEWTKQNHLGRYDSAWNNSYLVNKYTTIKDSRKEEYYSEEYKKIAAIPEVLAYYNMWRDQMLKIRNMLHMSYKDFSLNLIPWIKKDMHDFLADNPAGIFQELFRDFTEISPDNIELHSLINEDGHEIKVPVHYIQKLKNKKGEEDPNEKSLDLTRSLMKFTYAAYKTKHARDMEATLIGIREIHATEAKYYQKSDKDRNTFGEKLLNKVGNRIHYQSEVDDILKAIVDREIYGVHNSTDPKYVKIVTSLMEWNSKRLLGFSVIPAVAGGIAAKIAEIAKRGTFYSKEQGKEADKEVLGIAQDRLAGKAHKNKGDRFLIAMDPFIETGIQKKIQEAIDGKFKKYVNERTMYIGYQKSDEAVDMTIALAAARNYGFDKDNNLKKLQNLPKGTKSVYELFEFTEDSWTLAGKNKSDARYMTGAFRAAVWQMQYKIKGSMPPGDFALYQQNIYLKALMQFKSWMPGVISERTDGISYDKITDNVSIGRYMALKEHYRISKEDEEASGLTNLKNIVKVSGRMLAKVINRKLILEGSTKAIERSFSSLDLDTQLYFIGDSNSREIGLENYRRLIESQMNAMANELRAIFSLVTLAMAVGFDYGDDDEKLKDYNWASRQTYRVLRKINIELGFAYNPLEILQMNKGGIAILSLFSDALRVISNTLDESRDYVFGENYPGDTTGWTHYSRNMIYGMRQIELILGTGENIMLDK